MLEYDRIDISEVIDVNKTSASKECDICHYWYFKDIGLSTNHIFAMAVIIKCKKLGFNDVGIIYVKGSAYRIHFWYMSKDDAISIMINSNLIDKKGV